MKKLLLVFLLALSIVSVGAVYVLRKPSRSKPVVSAVIPPEQAKPKNTIDILSGTKYPVNTPFELQFTIKDKDNTIVKKFDTTLDEQMHLLVVRKDRTIIQHLHPTENKDSGVFSESGIVLSYEGDYRVYANFTLLGAAKDRYSEAISTTLSSDITVGDTKLYSPQKYLLVKHRDVVDGFDASFFYAPGDDSPGATIDTNFYAEQESTVAIDVMKAGIPFTTFEPYPKSYGNIVAIGPNLELISANSKVLDTPQSGLLIYSLTFPSSGLYKLFMQTKADNKVTTFELVLDIKPNPALVKQTKVAQ